MSNENTANHSNTFKCISSDRVDFEQIQPRQIFIPKESTAAEGGVLGSGAAPGEVASGDDAQPASLSGAESKLENIVVNRYRKHTSQESSKHSLVEIAAEIQSPSAELIEAINTIRDTYRANGGCKAGKEAIRSLKSELPAVAFNANGSRQECSVSNGIVSVDLDELGDRLSEARETLKVDPHCLFVFTSPSGDGLKALFKVPAPSGAENEMRYAHRRNFLAVQSYLKKYGLNVDPAASDLMRLCYLSHDPFCELIASAVELDINGNLPTDGTDPDDLSLDPEACGCDDNREKHDAEAVEALLMSIPPRPEYLPWLKISAAVRNALGDTSTAIAMLKRWSPEEQRNEYETLLNYSKFKKIGFGSLLFCAAKYNHVGVLRKCFYTSKGGYLLNWGGKFIPLSESNLRKHLKPCKIHASDIDKFLCDVRVKNMVDFVGEIAGHRSGLHEFNGNKLLVKKGPKIVHAQPGDGRFILEFVRTLLGEGVQFDAFMSWLKFARLALLSGTRKQTPAMVLVGGQGDGKSLLIEIVCRSLGGRSANAYKFLSGQTQFNADLVGAELLVVDDNAASKDHTSRAKLAQQVKGLLFAGSVAVEGKGVDALELAPIQALIMAVNKEPQNLRVLPELDSSMEDKIMLLLTNPSPLPEDLAGDRDRTQRRLSQELPHFLHQVENFDTEQWKNESTGRVRCHWNSELIQLLEFVSHENQLLELLLQEEFRFQVGWEGTAAEVQNKLTDSQAENPHAAKTLLNWSGACGTYLSKLAQKKNGVVERVGLTPDTRIQKYQLNLSVLQDAKLNYTHVRREEPKLEFGGIRRGERVGNSWGRM